MTVTFWVTAQHIADGQRTRGGLRCTGCAVALAMSEATGKPVAVGADCWWFVDGRSDYPLPPDLQAFVRVADLGGQLEPRQFTVEVPE